MKMKFFNTVMDDTMKRNFLRGIMLLTLAIITFIGISMQPFQESSHRALPSKPLPPDLQNIFAQTAEEFQMKMVAKKRKPNAAVQALRVSESSLLTSPLTKKATKRKTKPSPLSTPKPKPKPTKVTK